MKLENILVLFVLIKSVVYSLECFTAPCVRSAADIIMKLDAKVDPCDDFYDFACGSFFEEIVTPDEESTVDSLTLMSDKLQEFLLTLLSTPVKSLEPENHKLVKLFYQSCLNYGNLKMPFCVLKYKIIYLRNR